MSRNFELMQQLAGERTFHAPGSVESIFVEQAEKPTQMEGCHSTGDAILQLVQRVFLGQTDDSPRMVVFAGIDHRDGCSEIAASVADTLASNALGPVCLVEANFRSPTLPALFGTTNHHGFTDALLGERPVRSYAKPVVGDKLWLISAGALSSESAGLLTSERVKTRLAELRSEYTFIIIDAPPLTRYSDALAIGQCTDGLVLILEAGSSRREAAQLVAANVRSSKIPILAAVLNKRTFPIPEKLYRLL